MSGLQKVLVVDSGERKPDSALSAELAGLGYASVTAPFEATDDILALISSPVAVVLQMPHKAERSLRSRFVNLARRLKANLHDDGVPVILMGRSEGSSATLLLQSQLGERSPARSDV